MGRQFSNDRIAVVTGSAGFIGTPLCALLRKNNWIVREIDLNASIPRDILDIRYNDPMFADATHVFHLAALADIVPSVEHPARYMRTNVQGTINILEATRHIGAKFIYAASSSCYGMSTKASVETDPVDPKYPYALSKLMGEQAALHWKTLYKMKVCSLRLFNVYGRGMKATGAYGGVFKVFLPQLLAGEPLTVVGNGMQRRDFVHVKDVCQAFLLMTSTDKRPNGIYNVGTGNPIAINSLVKLLGGEAVHIPRRPGEPEMTRADCTRLRHLGWLPTIPFDEGVAEMVEHLEKDWARAKVWRAEGIETVTKPWMEALA